MKIFSARWKRDKNGVLVMKWKKRNPRKLTVQD